MPTARAACDATNPTLGLRCDREPHPPGTAHYQDDGAGVRAWHEPWCVQCHPAPPDFRCRKLGHTIRPN